MLSKVMEDARATGLAYDLYENSLASEDPVYKKRISDELTASLRVLVGSLGEMGKLESALSVLGEGSEKRESQSPVSFSCS